MSDVLNLLSQLEDEEAKAKSASKSSKKGKSPKDLAAQNASKNAGRKPRKPQNLSRQSSIASSVGNTYAPISPGQNLRPPRSSNNNDARSERSVSVGAESRRISFADPPRPGANKMYIPTKTDSLASGFPYDPRLNKYKVSTEEWRDFEAELIAAAEVPGPIWMWTFRKKAVIQRIRRDLQFDGNVGRVFKKWNRLFKRQRFQAWLELPGTKIQDENGEKVNLKKFHVVITPNSEQRAPSVYSRNSSMTRSITGEGVTAAMARGDANSEMTDDE